MTLIEAFFMYLGMALLIVQAYFLVPFLAFYLVLSFFRPDFEMNPKDL